MIKEHLILLAAAYAAHVDRSEQTVSKWITGHGRLFQRLRAGMGCNLNTAELVVRWFDENWPSDLDWPEAVERPSARRNARRRRAA
jgi:hypothetical protein